MGKICYPSTCVQGNQVQIQTSFYLLMSFLSKQIKKKIPVPGDSVSTRRLTQAAPRDSISMRWLAQAMWGDSVSVRGWTQAAPGESSDLRNYQTAGTSVSVLCVPRGVNIWALGTNTWRGDHCGLNPACTWRSIQWGHGSQLSWR